MESIFRRRSVRKFLELKVEDEKIEKILRAGMAGPSTTNQQPWEFYVTANKDILEKLSKCSAYASCIKNAPMAFIPCYREDVKYSDFAQIDLAIATQNMLLSIDQLGLGGVFLGVAPEIEVMDRVAEVLNLPSNVKAFCMVPCGYAEKPSVPIDRYNVTKVHFID